MKISLKSNQKQKIRQNLAINQKKIQLMNLLIKNNNEIEEYLTKQDWEEGFIKKKSTAPQYKNNSTYINSSLEELKSRIYERVQKSEDSNEKKILLYLIKKIDNFGFLKESVVKLKNEIYLLFSIDLETVNIKKLIDKLKSLFSYGIGSKNELEFKLWQVQTLKNKDILEEIIKSNSKSCSKKLLNTLKKKYKPNEIQDSFKTYFNLLNSPSEYFQDNSFEFSSSVDFSVSIDENNKLVAAFKEIKLPEITPFSEDLLKNKFDKSYVEYVKKKYESLLNFRNALKKRNEYLSDFFQVIADIQKDFFLSGNPETLAPLTYSDVKKYIYLSISTISRIVSSKKVKTDFGVFNLKDLFSRSISTDKNISIISVCCKIKRIIENKKNITDSEIVDELKHEGIMINRRSVVDYREKIGIKNSFIRNFQTLLQL